MLKGYTVSCLWQPDQWVFLSRNSTKLYLFLGNDILYVEVALNLLQLSTVLEQSVSRVWSDLTELMVSGIVSNDTLGPIRLLAKWERHRQRKMLFVVESPVLGQMGRFFILPQRRERSAAAQVQTLLDRYGIVTREMAMAEGLIWGDLYPVFDYLEHIGEVRRGYFGH